MGWVHEGSEADLYDHEGRCVAVDSDGADLAPLQVPLHSPSATGGTHTSNTAWWLYNGRDERPVAAGVRAGCECGWRSDDVFPVDFDDHEATDGFEFNDGPYAAWNGAHIEVLLGTAVPADIEDAAATVRKMLDGLAVTRPLAALAVASQLVAHAEQRTIDAAVKARRDGRTWEQVGDALGVSRQAAFQRFGRHLSA
jgi:hypothetical protein